MNIKLNRDEEYVKQFSWGKATTEREHRLNQRTQYTDTDNTQRQITTIIKTGDTFSIIHDNHTPFRLHLTHCITKDSMDCSWGCSMDWPGRDIQVSSGCHTVDCTAPVRNNSSAHSIPPGRSTATVCNSSTWSTSADKANRTCLNFQCAWNLQAVKINFTRIVDWIFEDIRRGPVSTW